MSDTEPTMRGRVLSVGSYANQWSLFVAWSEASGRGYLPASPEDVAAYLEDRSNAGARASTIRVIASAIARVHTDAGLEVPLRHDPARATFEGLMQERHPSPSRALPLDLNCYLAIRKTAYDPRSGRGGRTERAESARRRGELDVAMIGLMRDARLRVSEAATLTWENIDYLLEGTGRVRLSEADIRVISADTIRLLSFIRRGARGNELVLGMKPNQISIRIGAAAMQAGLGKGYSGDSPRLGMIRDLETLGVLLMGSHVAERES